MIRDDTPPGTVVICIEPDPYGLVLGNSYVVERIHRQTMNIFSGTKMTSAVELRNFSHHVGANGLPMLPGTHRFDYPVMKSLKDLLDIPLEKPKPRKIDAPAPRIKEKEDA